MKKTAILFFVLLFLLPAIGWADELKLIKGKGVEVCEAYHESLKGLHLTQLVCDDKEDTGDVKTPGWEWLDLKENRKLIIRAEKLFGSGGDQFSERVLTDKELASREKEGWFEKLYREDALRFAAIDMDNDDKAENVLLFGTTGTCMYGGPYSRIPLVLDEAKNLIDVKKTEPLLKSARGGDITTWASGLNYLIYDVFFYKGSTYFDMWDLWHQKQRDYTLTVYIQSKGKVKEVCKYKYESRLKKQGGKP